MKVKFKEEKIETCSIRLEMFDSTDEYLRLLATWEHTFMQTWTRFHTRARAHAHIHTYKQTLQICLKAFYLNKPRFWLHDPPFSNPATGLMNFVAAAACQPRVIVCSCSLRPLLPEPLLGLLSVHCFHCHCCCRRLQRRQRCL